MILISASVAPRLPRGCCHKHLLISAGFYAPLPVVSLFKIMSGMFVFFYLNVEESRSRTCGAEPRKCTAAKLMLTS